MAVLFCGGGGSPTPTVTWSRILGHYGQVDEDGPDEELTADDDRISIANNFLIISDTMISDEGLYFCTLTSSLGNTTSDMALLNIYGEKQISPVVRTMYNPCCQDDVQSLLCCLFSSFVVVFPTVTAPASLGFELGSRYAGLPCTGQGDPTPELRWLRLPEMIPLPSPAYPNYVCNIVHHMTISVVSHDSAGGVT